MMRDVARLVGINHVALEVDDLDEALAWYGRFFDIGEPEREGEDMAFVDMGDQFIAFSRGRSQPADTARHFGLVVDDKEGVRAALREAGLPVRESGGLDFRDPWGNHVQVVGYRDIQFTKAPEILRGMQLDGLDKTDAARAELAQKGLGG